MDRLSQGITEHRKAIVAVFLAIAAVCAFFAAAIAKNDNMVDYLPKDSESTVALALMAREFSGDVPNARVMVSDVELMEAVAFKAQLKALPGVSAVLWLDDVINLKQPLEMADDKMVREYYRDGAALYSVTIDKGFEQQAVDAIYALEDGKHVAVTGDAANAAYMESVGNKESVGAILILVPLILLILFLTTTSWLEPVLYMGTIGIAIVMNMGLTALTGEISFVTLAVSPILQLAVSLDYSIFLLHSFKRERKTGEDAGNAMRRAMKASFYSIAASAATTMFGFLALLFMRFRIGPDMGLNLVKGILFSYISVMVFLPALTLCCYKLLDKTRHKRFIPDISGLSRGLLKVRIPALIIVLIVVVPSILAQNRNDFIYGSGTPDKKTRYGQDTEEINARFGQALSMVVLVPRGDAARERALCDALANVENVSSVMAYVTTVGTEIPVEFMEDAIVENFYSPDYARIILTCDTQEEGDEAFALVERVREITGAYYDESYSCGQSANLYDMKNVVLSDNKIVSLLAIVAIGLTLLVTFKSLSIPLILLAVIESAIWINLAIPYFTGTSLSYIGFLVIHTVQLGATIDYAILFTQGYLRARQTMDKRAAINTASSRNLLSVIVSAVTLSGAGFCLYWRSTNTIVAAMGALLCRGTLLSFLMVVGVLPALLMLFDKVISKTTMNAGKHTNA